ncbi:MAG: lipid A biosynthesis lauroyl acyltransferase, partial [Candidatus Eiseniibacteriota bacterium]
MNRLLLRIKARLRDALKPLTEALVGGVTIALLRVTRYFDPDKTADFFGRATQLIGRHLREDRIGRANLKAAFPERSPEEIERILAGVWDNLGRIGAEFAHLDHIWDYDADHPEKPSRIEFGARSKQLFDALRDDGKPAIFFASHTGNWELPALGAVAHGLDCAILFRRPNSEAADRAIERTRAVKMGTLVPAGRDAPFKLGQALQSGQHVAMLVDQWLGNGVEVTFFGRKTKANP